MPSRLDATFLVAALALVVVPRTNQAQDRGAPTLRELVHGLTVTARVLVVGAHPDDDDPELVAWLARGRQVETGYLSLTRGESGQNFVGHETGVALGAIRTGELLAARRIDGGRLFFTRAYDFGHARSADEAFERWDHDALLDDVITVVRSFRPHVLVAVFDQDSTDADGQHQALARIARETFDAAADTASCPVERCGAPWTPLKLYTRGEGLSIHVGEYDPVRGTTYADLALESRAQRRSEGLLRLAASLRQPPAAVHLRRVGSRVGEGTAPQEASIFGGVDTSFARLVAGARPETATSLRAFLVTADSVRAALDLARPTAAVERLARVAGLANAIRRAAVRCDHPEVDAGPRRPTDPACDRHALDLDASVDLVRRRAHAALLAAAGVSVGATAEREFVGETDTVQVVVAIANRGMRPITVSDVFVAGPPGAPAGPMSAIVVPPDSTIRLTRVAAGLGPAKPWWLAPRRKGAFPPMQSSLDGLEHPRNAPPLVTVPGIAIPEEIRRSGQARVGLTIAETTVEVITPIVHQVVSPTLGVQRRPVGAVPDVTLAFERGLEWIPAGKPIDRRLRLAVRSFSNAPQRLSFRALVPPGLRLDSVPLMSLAPREQRDVVVRLRGVLGSGRHEFGVVGVAATGRRFFEGIQAIEYPHIPPVHLWRSSALYLQSVKVEVPPRLIVAYVQTVADGADAALAQLGVPSRIVTPDELPHVDLARFTTVVVGPRAYEAHPVLVHQTRRLLEFARNGGTLVVLNAQHDPRSPDPLPFPASTAFPRPEHVTAADAPVTVLEPRSRLLTWPNRIGPEDWSGWVGARALFVPTTVDERYAQVVEMHDPGQRENRNAILLARVGNGTVAYSTITFFEQLPAGVPGALRLFVNLLSAGCRPSGAGPARC